MVESAQTWLQTIRANAPESTWEGTVSTVSPLFIKFYINIAVFLLIQLLLLYIYS